MAEAGRSRLMKYVDSFNARDFDSVRLLLADDVELARTRVGLLYGERMRNRRIQRAGAI